MPFWMDRFFFWKHRQEIHPREIPALVINEVCPVNPGTALDEKTTTYEDYIELYNPTDSAVSLKDFYLSDDTKKPLAGPLPDVEIAAGGYYCVYAVGKDGSMPEGVPSVPFALTSGETVTLTTLAMSESGVTRPVTVDTVTLPSQQTADTVYARMEDGADTFSEMRPSPGSSNQEGEGTVTLNSISPDLSGQNWSGRYYTDYPVALTAEAPEGYSFVGWEIEGGETVSGSASDAQIQVRLETDTEIRAVFEENND